MNPPTACHDPALAAALRDAVLAQEFPATADRWRGNQRLEAFPSIDLAVAVFPPGAPPRAANVLFSREHPQGLVAAFEPAFGPVCNLRFDADLRDALGTSLAWAPGADWSTLPLQPLWPAAGDGAAGAGRPRVVAPYPASLLKLMVALGLFMAEAEQRLEAPEFLADLETMVTVSDNDATDRNVARLHRTGMVDALNTRLQREWGLPTLQLHGTTPRGGWRNADGAGVGRIHMTAWDTVRLLWLLDPDAPAAPWLPEGAPLLPLPLRRRLMAVLSRQQLDQILSSGALRDVPGWVPGLPDAPAFAHKTGTTDNYASDGGIVKHGDTHYAVAVLTNLGRRYAAPDAPGRDRCATTWRLPALGAAGHRLAGAIR